MTFAPGEDAPRPLLVNPSIEGGAALSPDGKWMAYTSDSSGQYEVYVRPFPEAGGKWQISRDGGKGAAWSRDGREIFYTHGDRMMGFRLISLGALPRAIRANCSGSSLPGDRYPCATTTCLLTASASL